MQISGDTIYYWIHQKFPQSEHVLGEYRQNILVHNLAFWDENTDNSDHLVVVDNEMILQNVHLEKMPFMYA